jgi:hypothetical protein
VIDRKRFRPSIRPKRIFGWCCRKRKKSCLLTFYFQAIVSPESKLSIDIINVLCMYVSFVHKSYPSTANYSCKPSKKSCFSLYKFTFLRCLLPCAEYSLSAEYSVASIFLPNIRFRPKQENPFSVDHCFKRTYNTYRNWLNLPEIVGTN